MELGLQFSNEEIETNRRLWQAWKGLQPHAWLQTHAAEEPRCSEQVTLRWENIWYSGKDLLTFAAPRLGQENPAMPRNRLRDWVVKNPEQSVDLLPEWQTLRQRLNQ